MERTAKVYVFLPDGTALEDEEFFSSIPDQSLLILSTKPSLKSPPQPPIDKLLRALRWATESDCVVERIRTLLNPHEKEKWSKILEHVEKIESRSNLSSVSEDPEWFRNLSTNAKTKEEYLKKSCQGRIRGYLAKAETQLRGNCKNSPEKIISTFKSTLRKNSFNGSYFDRKVDGKLRICDGNGMFFCEGRYDVKDCEYHRMHKINPYESQESRILFSTWNLDHVIERSRSVVPCLIEAVNSERAAKTVNADYFYGLLFTRDNLKLVHIVCHDKSEHKEKKCDVQRIYVNKK